MNIEVGDRVKELEAGLSAIYETVAKVSVDTHVSGDGPWWAVEKPVARTYDQAQGIMISAMDDGMITPFGATLSLLLLFDKTEKQVRAALLETRKKLKVVT